MSVKESAEKYLDTHHADGGPFNSEDMRKAYDAGAAEERKRSAGLLSCVRELARLYVEPPQNYDCPMCEYDGHIYKKHRTGCEIERARAAIAEFEKGSVSGGEDQRKGVR